MGGLEIVLRVELGERAEALLGRLASALEERNTRAGVAGVSAPVRPSAEMGRSRPCMPGGVEAPAAEDPQPGGEALPDGERPPAPPEPPSTDADDRQPGGVSLAPATQAPCPAPAADAGEAAGEAPALEPPPPDPHKGTPAYPWRTPARRAVMERDYPAGVEMREMRARMVALPGPALPEKNDALWRWVSALNLTRAEKQEDAGEAEEVPAAPVAEAPRETPQLVRARELLELGVHPNDIKQAVKLSAVEFGLVMAEHRSRGRVD